MTKKKESVSVSTEKFKVGEIIEAHERFGYEPELISVALEGCTELTLAEAKVKIEAFAKKPVGKKGVK